MDSSLLDYLRHSFTTRFLTSCISSKLCGQNTLRELHKEMAKEGQLLFNEGVLVPELKCFHSQSPSLQLHSQTPILQPSCSWFHRLRRSASGVWRTASFDLYRCQRRLEVSPGGSIKKTSLIQLYNQRFFCKVMSAKPLKPSLAGIQP